MSSRRAVTVVLGLSILLSVMPQTMPAALAFTEGSTNNFFGTGAGDDPSNTGVENSFFGGNAGTSNTTGAANSFFGAGAGAANTTGSQNAFFGKDAAQSNTTGCCNAFFGRSAGLSNTTACCNAFFGSHAGNSTTTGTNNAFFGNAAGFANNGHNNSFIGQGAGLNSTTGLENTFLGASAGLSNVTGIANTYVGVLAQGEPFLLNATALGRLARVSQSNSLVLGSIAGVNGAISDVRVGIGTPTPADSLHVRRTDGSAKVLVEEASGTTLGRELFELVNNGAARFRVRNTSNNATWDFQSSSNAGSFVIDRVGGPASLDFEMQPDGDLVVRGSATATSFITSSDRNAKTDITPANARKLMSVLRELDISTWRFKDQPKGTVNLGPMAQDFHRMFGMGTQTTIDVRDLAALALVAAQALDEEFRQEVRELKAAVAELTSER